ncbi:uncharacterized protein METZ01_LOCUS459940, partial [marine metagenome]
MVYFLKISNRHLDLKGGEIKFQSTFV